MWTIYVKTFWGKQHTSFGSRQIWDSVQTASHTYCAAQRLHVPQQPCSQLQPVQSQLLTGAIVKVRHHWGVGKTCRRVCFNYDDYSDKQTCVVSPPLRSVLVTKIHIFGKIDLFTGSCGLYHLAVTRLLIAPYDYNISGSGDEDSKQSS